MTISSVIAVTPHVRCDAGIATAAVRSGYTGLLDIGPTFDDHARWQLETLRQAGRARTTWGVRWDAWGDCDQTRLPNIGRVPIVALAGLPDTFAELSACVMAARHHAKEVIVEVTSLAAAEAAGRAGSDGVILKASEAGGLVSGETGFILAQRAADLTVPWWLHSAVGLDTAGCVRCAGGRGVVLGEELWLLEDAPWTAAERRRIAGLDGTETAVLGEDSGRPVRVFVRAAPGIADEHSLAAERSPDWISDWHRAWRDRNGSPFDRPIPLGQGVAWAPRLAAAFRTTQAALDAYAAVLHRPLRPAGDAEPLVEDSPLALAHRTKLPIVQGPMTRVSDTPRFADRIAKAGALPMLALALMRGGEVRSLLEQTKARLGERSWGVGLLGFVPPELRGEQLEVIVDVQPPFAIIAGGRPSQATELEASGIATYLHVPSPTLLRQFLEAGARKFVLEGRECGGHVGPRSSFVLWQSAIDVLLDERPEVLAEVQLLFAGGIHDEMSAAMVRTLTDRLVGSGVRIGILMGSAYLFTPDIVETGAITQRFQDEAIALRATKLLDTATGHATRCAPTPYTEEFRRRKDQLREHGASAEEMRFELELLNVGRLRVASKGLARVSAETRLGGGTVDMSLQGAAARLGGELTEVDGDTQHRDGMYMVGQLAALRDGAISLEDLHASVSARATELAHRMSSRAPGDAEASPPATEPIAIVGMACLFPEADELRTYWHNIVDGVDTIREVDPQRWDPDLFYSADRTEPDKVYAKWGAFLGEYRFDPLRYRIPPAAAKAVDPGQLLALDTARRALEDAGFDEHTFPTESTSVIFAASGTSDVSVGYVMRAMLPKLLADAGVPVDAQTQIVTDVRGTLPSWTEDSFPGLLPNVISGRIANRLDLRGANYTVDAACAASLAAVYDGVRQLRSGLCDAAVVGSVDLTNHLPGFMSFAATHALTPSGRSRPFDKDADGIVLGEGVAAVVLKRLGDAERDGDRIYAVIRGVGTSSDGRSKSLTAPHSEGQVLALERAYADAGVPSGSVTLVEAHATATAAGDRAELETLGAVFQGEEPYCAVGSVKSMIGHAKSAAGMAGLIKTALALHHGVLPPTINIEKPNAAIDFATSPFYLNTHTRPWIADPERSPRRAGLNAFGFGGTNFHAVLEEYGEPDRPAYRLDLLPRPVEVFTWADDDREKLAAMLTELRHAIAGTPEIRLDQLARSIHATASGGPATAAVRVGLVAATAAELLAAIDRAIVALNEGNTVEDPAGIYVETAPPIAEDAVAFLYPGQGSQYPDMLSDLLLSPVFGTRWYEQADRILAAELPAPISSVIYPVPTFDDDTRRSQRRALNDTRNAQPALGVTNLAAHDVLTQFNLRPAMTAGHSYGEYVALCVAGTVAPDDLLVVSAKRGVAIHEASSDTPGSMASVAADAATLEAAIERLGLSVYVANYNAPGHTVIAGETAELDRAIEMLVDAKLHARRIPVSAPFHCPLVAEASRRIVDDLVSVDLRGPQRPVYANVTAEPYPHGSEEIRALLAEHLASPVRFVDQIRNMYRDGARVFFEVGPGRTLTNMVGRILEDDPHVVIPLDNGKGRPTWSSLAHLLARAHALGLPVDVAPWFRYRPLTDESPSEYLARLGAEAAIKPTDLVVSAVGVRSAADESTPQPVDDGPSREAGRAPPTEQTPPTASEAGAPQIADEIPPRKEPSVSATPHQAPSPQFAGLQSMVTQWFELQTEQTRLLQRLLSLEERMVASPTEGSLSAVAVPASPAAEMAAVIPAPAAPAAPVPAALVVAPAPVLPVIEPMAASPPQETPGETGAAVAPAAAVAAVAAVDTLPADPSAAAVTGNGAVPSAEAFERDLINEVSERTGYPKEMLDVDLPLESGLGIDSIKVMEIFSNLKPYHHVLAGEEQDEEEILQSFIELKTLGDIVGYYRERAGEMSAAPAEEVVASPFERPAHQGTEETVAGDDGATPPTIERSIVAAVPAPAASPIAPQTGISHPADDLVLLVLGDVASLPANADALLQLTRYRVCHVLPGGAFSVASERRYTVDFTSEASLESLRRTVAEQGRLGAVLNLMGLGGEFAGNDRRAPLTMATWLLNTAKVFADDLQATADPLRPSVVNVTAIDGRFGLGSSAAVAPAQAASIGLVKSLGKELRVLAKNIDLDLAGDGTALAAALVGEVSGIDDLREIGYDGERRWTVALERRAPTGGGMRLDSGAVLLVTGGALGIGATSLHRLVSGSDTTVVLVGRSEPAHPTDEPDELRGLETPEQLRAALVEAASHNGGTVTPSEIERRVAQIVKTRRLSSNLAALEAAGATVEYHSLDVRDDERFGALIDDVYRRHGRIDGVIHAAGVVEDQILAHKDAASFARVFDTKVRPALTLAATLRPEDLGFLVFFSSVSARFGNASQLDYAAANEVLNKLADQLNRSWPAGVVAINWGPWDAGMLSPGLRNAYAERGIELIDPEVGAAAFLDEINSFSDHAEVVLACGTDRIAGYGLEVKVR